MLVNTFHFKTWVYFLAFYHQKIIVLLTNGMEKCQFKCGNGLRNFTLIKLWEC